MPFRIPPVFPPPTDFTYPVTFHGAAAALSPIEQVCAARAAGRNGLPHGVASSRDVLKFGFGLVESGRPTGLYAVSIPTGTFASGVLYTRGRAARDRVGRGWDRVGGWGTVDGGGVSAGVGCGLQRKPHPTPLPVSEGASRSGENGTGSWAVVDLGVCRARCPGLLATAGYRGRRVGRCVGSTPSGVTLRGRIER